MKKIKIILIVCLILSLTIVSANALESPNKSGNIYELQGVTIQFESNSNFDLKEQNYIAEFLVYGNEKTSPYGLSCLLFGHNYETEVVTSIKHKARATAPRCLEEIYDIQVCSKCGDIQKTLLASRYIYCCS